MRIKSTARFPVTCKAETQWRTPPYSRAGLTGMPKPCVTLGKLWRSLVEGKKTRMEPSGVRQHYNNIRRADTTCKIA